MELTANQQASGDVLSAQREHWEQTFISKPTMFGDEPSYPGRIAARLFKIENKVKVLELGAGQGRDSLFFAREGFNLTVLDYSDVGLSEIQQKAKQADVSDKISTVGHDVRRPLPFQRGSFDAVYSHMLYCMALTTTELTALCR